LGQNLIAIPVGIAIGIPLGFFRKGSAGNVNNSSFWNIGKSPIVFLI
jgi:MoaA/NifB/PqqE/SkfB family radical SAM enzyme